MNNSSPKHRLPDVRMIAVWPNAAAGTSDRELPNRHQHGLRAGGHHTPGPEDAVVRPFLLTGGRTRPIQDGLRVESMVATAAGALYAPLRFERRAIVRRCHQPCSLAEVASSLRLPLGVVTVLVADLLAEGLLVQAHNDELPIDILERIRDCVRAL